MAIRQRNYPMMRKVVSTHFTSVMDVRTDGIAIAACCALNSSAYLCAIEGCNMQLLSASAGYVYYTAGGSRCIDEIKWTEVCMTIRRLGSLEQLSWPLIFLAD